LESWSQYSHVKRQQDPFIGPTGRSLVMGTLPLEEIKVVLVVPMICFCERIVSKNKVSPSLHSLVSPCDLSIVQMILSL
jgi:hypothetical protein